MDNNDATAAVEVRDAGWLGRNWKWFVPLVVFMVFALLALVAVALFAKFVGKGELLEIYRADKIIKASEPYRMAMEELQADPQVIERLGEPVEVTEYASGSVDIISEDGKEAGNANFYFDLTGPKGTANVACQGKMIDGSWGLSTLAVTFADGKRHLVEISGDDDGLEEAPAWSP